MKFIPLDAVLAEIEKRKHRNLLNEGAFEEDIDILSFINSLEVKEVDEQNERMTECPYRQVVCTMYEGKILECNGACSWVVDYPKLKELKAQKGE